MASASPDATGAPGRRGISFRTRLLVSVCGLVLVTGATIGIMAFRSARTTTEVLVDSLFREVSNHAVTHSRTYVFRALPLVESMRKLSGTGLAIDDRDLLARQLVALLEANPGMSWISFSNEAGDFTGAYRPVEGGLRVNQSRIVEARTRLTEHDVLLDGTWKLFKKADDTGYDPRQRPFYKKAKQEMRQVWLPPYVFYNQGVPGISCAAPVTDAKGKLLGVVSVDFDLTALSDFTSRLKLSEHSTVFLFTTDGALLAHPNRRTFQKSSQMGEGKLLTLSDTGDPLVDAYRAAMGDAVSAESREEAFHFFEFRKDGANYLATATTFRLGDDLTWVVGAIAPEDDFLADVWRNQLGAIAAGVAALAAALLVAVWMASRVSGPVQALIGFMQRVGAGDLDARAEFGGYSEFQRLAAALNQMIAELRDHVRLRHSLSVAMQVQQRLLPQTCPKVTGLDIAGHSTYCDETGGDYYDFLVIDPASKDRVLIALGDVMGHGVAAALVMAGARAVLRDRADKEGALTELMARINRLIAADHEGTRFMTMHLAVLDVPSGVYRWVSAGHDPAMIYDPRTGQFEEQDVGDMPLGIMDDVNFTEHQCGPLREGHIIVVGTDGVWEMPNMQEEQFGKDRLRDVIRANAGRSAEEISAELRRQLVQFRGDAKAVDDVTFVILKMTTS